MKTQKSNLEHESVIISWILNKKKKTPDIENKFSKEYCKKEDEKKKKCNQIIWRLFFPSLPPLLFPQSLEKRNLFLPSSLNWMQFIASTKLVFHRPWQPMRICLLSVASGANMQKVAAGRRDSVKGRREGKAGRHSPESIHDRGRERWVFTHRNMAARDVKGGEKKVI